MKKQLLALVFMCSTYLYNFCNNVGIATDSSTQNIMIVDVNIQGHAIGAQVYGSSHSIEDSDFSGNGDGLHLASDNSVVRMSTMTANSGTGFMHTGNSNQVSSLAINNNNVGLNDSGSNLTTYDNYVTLNTTDNLVNTNRSDYLYGFEGTFTVLEKIQGIAQDTLDTVTACCPCEYFITQHDIPYTISEPGFYCVTEHLTAGVNYAINITSTGVTLDLRDKIIAGGGIQVTADNVVVRNGTISSPSAEGIFIDGASDVTVKNISIISATSYAFSVNLASNVIVDNVSIISPSTSGFELKDSSDLHISNCSIKSATASAALVVTSVSDSSFVNITARDCVLFVTAASDFSYVNNNNIYDSCISYNSTSGNSDFYMQDSDNVKLRNCISYNATTRGFNLTNNKMLLYNCQAIDSGSIGIQVTGSETIIKECITKGCASDGFLVTSSASSIIDCQSVSNTGNGFDINATNVILRGCIAEDNTYGFHWESGASGCKALSCCAVNNTYGFVSDNAIAGSNRFFNNIAYDNTSTDFNANITIAPVLSSTSITSTVGNYWLNIST